MVALSEGWRSPAAAAARSLGVQAVEDLVARGLEDR